MRLPYRIAIFVGVVALLAFGVVRKYAKLQDQEDLRIEAALLRDQVANFNLDSLQQLAAAKDTVIAGLTRSRAALQEELDGRSEETAASIGLRDAVRSTISEDTLSAGLRNLLAVERGVAESYRIELDVSQRINHTLDSTVAVLAAELDRTRLALWTIGEQRDTALEIISGYERSLSFSIGDLFAGIGQKAVCAAGGGMASAAAGGNVVLGAGIGLTFCLLEELL